MYYDIDTGDVVTVTNKEKDFIPHSHIVTDSDDVPQILMGSADPKKICYCRHQCRTKTS